MYWRSITLAAVSVGALSGAVTGLAVDTTMKPPPDSVWENKSETASSADALYYYTEAGPQDLEPITDRQPTWKRAGEFPSYAYGLSELDSYSELELDPVEPSYPDERADYNARPDLQEQQGDEARVVPADEELPAESDIARVLENTDQGNVEDAVSGQKAVRVS